MVAGGILAARVEHGDLPLPADGRAGNQRRAGGEAGGVHRVAGGEVVRAVQHHVRRRHRRREGRAFQLGGAGFDACVRVDALDGTRRGLHLRRAHRLQVVDDLALQIGEIHAVVIHQVQIADAGGGEIQRRRRTQAAQPHHQRPCAEQRLLPGDVHLRQHHLPAVAHQLRIVHG